MAQGIYIRGMSQELANKSQGVCANIVFCWFARLRRRSSRIGHKHERLRKHARLAFDVFCTLTRSELCRFSVDNSS